MDALRWHAASVSGARRLRSGTLNKLIRTADKTESVHAHSMVYLRRPMGGAVNRVVDCRVYLWDVPARRERVKRIVWTDSAQAR